jgi:tetratricopeptide (TPR) repeat protein
MAENKFENTGDFRGAALFQGSTIQNAGQIAGTIRNADQGTRDELQALLKKLSEQLNALAAIGQRTGDNSALDDAITAYRDALKEQTRERDPLGWAMTQNNLGGAFFMLGKRESGTARFQQAVDAYRNALKEWTRARVPLDWAMTQHNLGLAFFMLGERESGTAHLQQAVDAYRDALEERTRERVPFMWAATQSNLSKAQALLDERLQPLQKS